ncbi:MAG: hypothetical protein IIC82_06775 [Chloroflexi bacterium]|nr:hypothetical protein [Chloroflexota bacterium]
MTTNNTSKLSLNTDHYVEWLSGLMSEVAEARKTMGVLFYRDPVPNKVYTKGGLILRIMRLGRVFLVYHEHAKTINPPAHFKETHRLALQALLDYIHGLNGVLKWLEDTEVLDGAVRKEQGILHMQAGDRAYDACSEAWGVAVDQVFAKGWELGYLIPLVPGLAENLPIIPAEPDIIGN